MIQSVTYARLYNLGNYENEKLEVTVTVDDDNAAAAFALAIDLVNEEHTQLIESRRAPKYQQLPSPATMPAPASSKQRNYIATLMDELGWHSEQVAVYAREQGVDLVSMTSAEASTMINGLKRLIANQQADDLL